MSERNGVPKHEGPQGQWRLDRIEVVNWGTFQGHHVIEVPRKGFLLTGHSGSGKSSVVDAVTAVLTPRVKATFNTAAADASARGGDRTVLTYVRGAYSRGADEDSGEITTRYLRPPKDTSGKERGGTWSGLLLRYSNGGGEQAHLVKLFHAKRGASASADVHELHLLTQEPLQLLDLQPYAKDGLKERELKKARPEAYVHKQHARFAARFSRVLGLTGERAALLLHRTQSAKNLGSLDDLFRGFMLDEPETFDLADRAVEQFTELSEAHQAVVRAREQVAHLEPLEGELEAYDDAADLERRTRVQADALDDFTHGWKLDLTRAARDEAGMSADSAEADHQQVSTALESADQRVRDARAAVDARGGAQLEALEEKAQTRQESLRDAQTQFDRLKTRLGTVGLPVPENQAEMAQLHRSAAELLADKEAATTRSRAGAQEMMGRKAHVQARLTGVVDELDAMKRNRSNVGHKLMEARSRIATAAGLPERSLPFAAELMQVRSEHSSWTGAVERVLRPLSTVILVPTAHEVMVTAAVDAHHLGTRIKVTAIPAEMPSPPKPTSEESLVYKVEVSPGVSASVRDWLHHELSRRFDFPCVETAQELAGLDRGVTRAGQVKRGRRSYEKDDSSRIDDRSRWILGFTNDQKVEHFVQLRRDLDAEMAAADRELGAMMREHEAQLARTRALEEVAEIEWSQVDVESRRRSLEEAQQARVALLADDGDLRAAQQRLTQSEQTRATAAQNERDAARRMAGAQSELERLTRTVLELQAQEAGVVEKEVQAALRHEFAAHRTQRTVTHTSVETDARKVAGALHARIDVAAERQNQSGRRILKIMMTFRTQWPAAAADLGAEVESRSGYLVILESLRADRLPDFEQRFFRMLREQSQQNIGLLAERIRSAPREIRRRVDPINGSLLRSQFATGRYLQIQVAESRPAVVKEFLADLNTITTGVLAVEDEPAEAERRFQLLARIMGQLGSSESADRTWRRHCLDTRRHVRFLGLEQDPDGVVVDWYDSGRGRSGGQKQKLVVFCLAAALRYQLTRATDELPSYASIVMDEAFDKADTRFTRMALDIFTEFGFHMILATPLKMLQVLEDYVGGMTLITSPDGQSSYASPVPFDDDSIPASDDRTSDEDESADALFQVDP